eukprot:5400565-Pyramimonas_sp.AAC.1
MSVSFDHHSVQNSPRRLQDGSTGLHHGPAAPQDVLFYFPQEGGEKAGPRDGPTAALKASVAETYRMSRCRVLAGRRHGRALEPLGSR